MNRTTFARRIKAEPVLQHTQIGDFTTLTSIVGADESRLNFVLSCFWLELSANGV